MSTVLGGCDRIEDFADFDAVTISRTGSFELDMTPEEALPLFTGPGEELWIPTWKPVILNGDGYEPGTVFVTSNHGHTTYWHVVEYDTEAKHARYLRITPQSNTGTVDVSLAANEQGGSTVTVAYDVTGLSPAGNADIAESFSESHYAEMMQEWPKMIAASREKIDAHFGR